ncbi:hypothetical protein EFR43_03010, partial [Lactobacillus delbrueckii subsp. lactis]|nr:hypothetical protein [Lactobacillus delbrueckii subsp. lactis]
MISSKILYSLSYNKKPYLIKPIGDLTGFRAKKNGLDMTPEIRTLISGVIFMTKYTKEIKLAI